MADHRGGRELTLQLDLVLNNQGLVGVVNLVGELGGNSMVGRLVLDNKTLLALHTLEDVGLLNRPLANVGPLLISASGVLLGVGGLPSRLPVVGKLLDETGGRLQGGRLRGRTVSGLPHQRETLVIAGERCDCRAMCQLRLQNTGFRAVGDDGRAGARLTVKVGSSIGEAAEGSSATVSSARTLKAKKAAVRAEVNLMVGEVSYTKRKCDRRRRRRRRRRRADCS